jgi:hypothetical protein
MYDGQMVSVRECHGRLGRVRKISASPERALATQRVFETVHFFFALCAFWCADEMKSTPFPLSPVPTANGARPTSF